MKNVNLVAIKLFVASDLPLHTFDVRPEWLQNCEGIHRVTLLTGQHYELDVSMVFFLDALASLENLVIREPQSDPL